MRPENVGGTLHPWRPLRAQVPQLGWGQVILPGGGGLGSLDFPGFHLIGLSAWSPSLRVPQRIPPNFCGGFPEFLTSSMHPKLQPFKRQDIFFFFRPHFWLLYHKKFLGPLSLTHTIHLRGLIPQGTLSSWVFSPLWV